MEFSAEWKSLWPISSAFSPPLLLSNKNPKTPLGPLIFNPDPNTPITQLLHSPSLSPCLPPPYPNLALSRFLQQYDSIPSSAASISSILGPQLPDYSSLFHGFNSLQLLRIPDKNLIIVFFPTGDNSDNVGFATVSVKDGTIAVHSQRENFFQQVKEDRVNRQRITRLLVSPVDDFCGDGGYGDAGNANKSNGAVVIGLLMVCTDYSVSWYKIGISSFHRQNEFSVCLNYLGCCNAKNFKGNAVISACWSPHLRQECLILLENSDLLLFDIDYSCESSKGNFVSMVSGKKRTVRKRVQLLLNDKVGWEEEDGGKSGWLGCAFSWHPRIFLTSHCNAVFLVDLRSGECDVSCLLKIETLSMVKNDKFVAFSRVASDGFFFTVATKSLLLLCDVRKPLMPVLRWAHSIRNPHYMTVFRLSELRANANENKYEWASESGHCILLGSFWDGEFCLFCYGPDDNENGTVSSEISKFCDSYYAWGLPSELSLTGFDCNCGSCLVGGEFSKVSLPVWVDWRQKNNLVLGFGILDSDFSTPSSFGGFTLIRLTSSGKLEAQQYLASWKLDNFLEVGHKRKSNFLEDNLLYDRDDSEYDGPKKFQHLKLGFLNSYLSDNLAQYIVRRREVREESGEEDGRYKMKSDSIFHQEICERLKALGLPGVRSRSSLVVSDVLKDIGLPTSIHEVALRSIWAGLPTNLLQFGFCTYSDFYEDSENHNNEPLEFLDIPNQPQMPPFPSRRPSFRSNKWSGKVRPSDKLIGPILPPLFLTTLHKLSLEELKKEKVMYREETEEFSARYQLKNQCGKIVELIEEHVLDSCSKTDFVSLGSDTDYNMKHETQNSKFSYHRPWAFSETSSGMGMRESNDVFRTHVFKRSQVHAFDLGDDMVGEELFDVGCPVELKFVDSTIGFGVKELEAYRVLKKHDLQFQNSFEPYRECFGLGTS